MADVDRAAADRAAEVIGGIVRSIGDTSWESLAPDLVVLARPAGHAADAVRAVRLGAHVVSVSDDVEDVESLLRLDGDFRAADRSLVVGAGFAPGLTCVLARHGANELDRVDEIHVAKTGTAGPACARQHHRSLAAEARDWRDGRWVRQPGGSGRELVWFPDPIAGADCYRAALPDPLLLHDAFPGVRRITARMSATRRDRLTARLPMLTPPHAEAGPGAVRAEVRGLRDGQAHVVVLGCMDRPSVGAGAVLAVAAGMVADGGITARGAHGLAAIVDPVPFLHTLAERGVRCARFEGSAPGGR